MAVWDVANLKHPRVQESQVQGLGFRVGCQIWCLGSGGVLGLRFWGLELRRFEDSTLMEATEACV